MLFFLIIMEIVRFFLFKKVQSFIWRPYTHVSLADVVGVFVNISGQAKITDLHNFVFR